MLPTALVPVMLATFVSASGAQARTSATPADTAAPVRERDAVEELLRLHHRQRQAHVVGDAELLVSSFAPSLVEVEAGRIRRTARPDALRRFSAYFRAAMFLEWDDIRPPVILPTPDGDAATVLVEKRVRALVRGEDGAVREHATRFAWAGTWRRGPDGEWRLEALASTDRPSGDADTVAVETRVAAYDVLRRARIALGGEAAVASIATLAFTAACEGPDGPFETEVRSARDGRIRFHQRRDGDRPDFAAGIALDGAWQRADDGPATDSVGPVLRTVMRAHEIHLLTLAPEARYRAPADAGTETIDGRAARVVRFRDPLGAPSDFFYDTETGLPLGYRVVDPTAPDGPRVVTLFDDWREVGDVRLPFTVRIRQGADRFRYRMTEVSVDWIPDRGFRPPA